MSGWRTAWKEAARVFVLSRLIIVLITTLNIFVFPQFIPPLRQQITLAPPYTSNIYSLNVYIFSWFRWDVKAYVNISFQGYKYIPDTAFFPLWPLLQHFGGLLLGGYIPDSYYLAGLLLANICFYFALVLLYRLLSKDFEPALARRGLLYFTFAPYALFFFAGYSESLFVLLCIAIFLLLRRGRPLDWWLAGLLGFLAALTRSSGVLLIVPFLVVYIQRFWTSPERQHYNWLQKLNALAPIVLIPAGVLVYMLYLNYAKGNPLIFRMQEDMIWRRHFSFPWETLGIIVRSISTPPPILIVGNIFYTISSLIPAAVLAFGWKRIPLHYRLFALALLAFALSFPADVIIPLYSHPRYMMVIFPITVILAIWGKHPRFHRWFIPLSLVLFTINVILFTGNYWVS
jgi:hypothetical protein